MKDHFCWHEGLHNFLGADIGTNFCKNLLTSHKTAKQIAMHQKLCLNNAPCAMKDTTEKVSNLMKPINKFTNTF